MLAAKIPAKETIKVVEEAIPVPKKGEVLIQMKASALCRSDLHRYHGTPVRAGFIHVPFLPQQAKEGVPSMALEEIVKALEICIEQL